MKAIGGLAGRRKRGKIEDSINTRVPIELKRELEEVSDSVGESVSLLAREGFKLIIAKVRRDGRLVVEMPMSLAGRKSSIT
jgi:hypothetical protein